MPAFTALATMVYKGPGTVAWANSVKSDLDYLFTGCIKAWVHFDGTTATVTAFAAHNVSNIVDEGAGRYRIVWTTGFSSSGYAVFGTAKEIFVSIGSTGIQGASVNIATVNADGVATDTTAVTVAAIGVSA